MTARRLTPHQREVYGRLSRRSVPTVTLEHDDGSSEVLQRRWVKARDIGSAGALEHIVAKGYAERREVRGPRGGYSYEYRVFADELEEGR